MTRTVTCLLLPEVLMMDSAAYLEPHPDTTAWLRQMPEHCVRYGGALHGAFLLGSAGMPK